MIRQLLRLSNVFTVFCAVHLAAQLTVAPPVHAQQALGIAATVNDEAISLYDLQARLNMVVAFSRLPDVPETKRRLVPQVLRGLVEDKLKLQEAKRLGINVSQLELRQARSSLEAQLGLKAGEFRRFVEGRRLDKTTIMDQLEARVAWTKIIRQRFLPSILINDDEVDAILKDIERSKGQPENLIAEIFLPIDSTQTEAAALALAERVHQQLSAGANFASMARNFSQSPTAAVGGNLGWNKVGQLGRGLDAAVSALQPGQFSAPIRTREGVYILLLRQRRVAQGLDQKKEEDTSVVTLFRVHLPLNQDASDDKINQEINRGRRIAAAVNNCADMTEIAKASKSNQSGPLGKFPTNQLAPNLREVVTSLPPLKASQPVRLPDGVAIFMVCEREGGNSAPEISPRDQVMDRLVNERLALSARQYLRDLRRSAFVDIRL